MIITRLEEMEKTKVRVYIDEDYAFLLYQKDINRYHLEVGMELSQNQYDEIIEDTIYRRAKQKALAILKYMDRSEFELRKKLKEAGYTEGIVDRTIEYLYEYNYINDERFALLLIKSKKSVKSKMILRMELLKKGISKELLDELLQREYEDSEDDPELTAIRKAIAKKTRNIETLSQEEKQKLIASLYRKGFQMDKIKQILNMDLN